MWKIYLVKLKYHGQLIYNFGCCSLIYSIRVLTHRVICSKLDWLFWQIKSIENWHVIFKLQLCSFSRLFKLVKKRQLFYLENFNICHCLADKTIDKRLNKITLSTSYFVPKKGLLLVTGPPNKVPELEEFRVDPYVGVVVLIEGN